MFARFAVAALALTLAAPALAEEDRQVWTAATATIPAGERTVIWLEAQGRFFDDADRLGQLLLRPGIGYKVGPTTTLFAGYAYVATNPGRTGATREHRIWQQASFRIAGDGRGVTLTGRSRLEQRFVEGRDDTGYRFRQLLRLTVPVGAKGVQAVGWTEGFFGLNATDAGQPAGFDRARNFAGVSLPVARAFRLEPGYMYERINLPRDDRNNHIASVTLNMVF